MTGTLELPFTAEQLKQAGISLAAESAGEKWNENAFLLLKAFLAHYNDEFMAEQFRAYCEGKIETPPSKRAFGGIISRAHREGLIAHCGYGSTTNPKAHGTPASIWKKI